MLVHEIVKRLHQRHVQHLNRARENVREAEEKLRTVKKWGKVFDTEVLPLAQKLENLRHICSQDLPKAAHYLLEVLKT